MKTYALLDNSFFEQKPWWIPNKLYRVICQRSNPRSKEYLLKLLKTKFSNVKLINQSDLPCSAENVVLLYADAIGLGNRSLELQILKKTKNVTVLNARSRVFSLTFCTHRKLLLKRTLEVTFLPEIVFAPFCLLIGSFFAVKDKLIGSVAS